MNPRIISSITLLFLIAFGPFWIYIPALLILAGVLPFYFEAIIFGFIIDVLYGGGQQSTISLVYPFAICASLVVIALLPIKEMIRVN